MAEIMRPTVLRREFKNMDAALDYVKFIYPEQLQIGKLYDTNGNMRGVELHYLITEENEIV